MIEFKKKFAVGSEESRGILKEILLDFTDFQKMQISRGISTLMKNMHNTICIKKLFHLKRLQSLMQTNYQII